MLRIFYDDFEQKVKNIHDEMDLHHSYEKSVYLYRDFIESIFSKNILFVQNQSSHVPFTLYHVRFREILL